MIYDEAAAVATIALPSTLPVPICRAGAVTREPRLVFNRLVISSPPIMNTR